MSLYPVKDLRERLPISRHEVAFVIVASVPVATRVAGLHNFVEKRLRVDTWLKENLHSATGLEQFEVLSLVALIRKKIKIARNARRW